MIRPNIPQEDLDRVADLVAQALAKRFSREEFVFGPIVVTPDFDWDGDEILWIQIVFDGDQDNLDPGWTGSLGELISPGMKEIGVTAFPLTSFIEKSEWEDPAYAVPEWEYDTEGEE